MDRAGSLICLFWRSDMPRKPDTSTRLALEIMPEGCSLITFEGDTPLECLASAQKDDPKYADRTAALRDCAQDTLGKNFHTQIWMSDEHLRIHCAMLRAKSKGERRKEAASALSAMSPFHATELCFDLGVTDSEGYTPIAAIPKEKMDEAVAFARDLKLNPMGVTTSDDVVGFAARPVFEPLAEEVRKSSMPARAAGIAAILALPVIGWDGGYFDGFLGDGQPAQHVAFVASVGSVSLPGERFDIVVPGHEAQFVRPAVALGGLTAPTQAAPVNAPDRQSFFVTVQDDAPRLATVSPNQFDSPHLRAVSYAGGLPSLPKVPTLSAPLPSDLALSGPMVLEGVTAWMRAPAETGAPYVRVNTTVAYAPDAAPGSMFSGSQREWRDARPRVETASVMMPGLTGIRPTVAREDVAAVEATPASNGFDDAYAVQVANIGEGTLVQKPAARTRVLVLQPSRSVSPPARPGPKLPEEAFDFSTLVPITSDGAGQDATPAAMPVLGDVPVLRDVDVLSAVTFDPPLTVTQDLRAARMARAVERSGLAPDLVLRRPPVRDLAPPNGEFAAIVQTSVVPVRGIGIDVSELMPAETGSTDVVPGFLAATQLDALPLDVAVVIPAEPVDPLAGVDLIARPVARPGSTPVPDATQGVDATEAVDAVVAALQLARPPVRPVAEPAVEPEPVVSAPEVPATPEAAVAAAQAAEALALPRPPQRAETVVGGASLAAVPAPVNPAIADGADPATAVVDPVEVAALSLPRPPSRKKVLVQLAAINDPSALFASPQAVPLAQTPISRPGDLKERAAAIRARRAQEPARQVAAVTPGATTAASSLRLPSSAQVARAATIEDGINLGGVSLIGIFGTANARRALVRLPQGRYVQVKRGDRVRGWTVSAISEDNIRVQKGAQNSILRMPN